MYSAHDATMLTSESNWRESKLETREEKRGERKRKKIEREYVMQQHKREPPCIERARVTSPGRHLSQPLETPVLFYFIPFSFCLFSLHIFSLCLLLCEWECGCVCVGWLFRSVGRDTALLANPHPPPLPASLAILSLILTGCFSKLLQLLKVSPSFICTTSSLACSSSRLWNDALHPPHRRAHTHTHTRNRWLIDSGRTFTYLLAADSGLLYITDTVTQLVQRGWQLVLVLLVLTARVSMHTSLSTSPGSHTPTAAPM